MGYSHTAVYMDEKHTQEKKAFESELLRTIFGPNRGNNKKEPNIIRNIKRKTASVV
jgi:hypothetical protein